MKDKDKKDWEKFLENPSNIFDKEITTITKKNSKKFNFDLHGYSIDDANKKVYEIITFCYQNGYSEILIITGKGIHSKSSKNVYISEDFSTLKNTIPDFIKNNADLSSKISGIEQADKKSGGSGAFLIKLKRL